MDRSEEFSALIALAFSRATLKKLIFSRPFVREEKKITARLTEHRGRRLLALEFSLPGDTVRHKNLTEAELRQELGALIRDYAQVNLITTLGDAEYKVSRSGKYALLGADKLMRAHNSESTSFESAIEALDNKKNYILSGNEDFLVSLGISDKTGRVHDKKQGKFRQINRFLEHIEDIYPSLPGDGDLTVYDLCCGKSYLSFAVYYYLTAIKKREVKMLGIDLKRDVIIWCQNEAERLGYMGMRFICDDIKNLPDGKSPDMVISLHACDVATDIVINRAIELGAGVILSTPCCHRYLNDKVNMPSLEFVTRFPHLRNKLCEALTDAIRLARLEEAGYRVSAPELTDPDDTPKNTLIRAVKTGKAKGDGVKYQKILELVLGDKKDDYLRGM
ncbi:MAG: SAM-dependent methyltransferase [Clostridia bacterium]|nr:SAM-dependent methyltransferase [Clostridia bacterium]